MQRANQRWAWGWGWLLVVAAAGVFLRWAALSCYHDSIDSKGPGGAITWVVTAILYGLSYAALLPAYVWLISPRPLWALVVIGPLLFGSFCLLHWYTDSGLAGREAAWDHRRSWAQHQEAYGPYRLLLSLQATGLLVLLGIGLRLWLHWSSPTEPPAPAGKDQA